MRNPNEEQSVPESTDAKKHSGKKRFRDRTFRPLSTTFGKLTMGFLLIGLVPLFMISIAIFATYYNKTSRVMISNYMQITDYFSRNVEELFDSLDAVMEQLYDYETEDGTLGEVIRDEEMEESDRTLYVTEMLRELLTSNSAISSERFVDQEGRVYSLFSEQSKTLRNDAGIYTPLMTVDDTADDLLLYSTISESLFCVESSDYIFTLSRNFMDISSVEKIRAEILGTFYLDVNVEVIADMIEDVSLDEGDFYLYNPQTSECLYSPDDRDYQEEYNSLQAYTDSLTAESGSENTNGHWIFYEEISDTGFYVVLLLDENVLYDNVLGNTTILLLVLCFVVFLLLGLYMFFSRHMSQPIGVIRHAMQEVQQGNLSVRAEVATKDEMRDVADGFNQMVEDLQKYIDEVYVAQICQKEAELNALKMQIQPHFLYNTLDIIRMTALENDDKESAELLESLAFQLRYLLGEQNEKISIREEIRALQEYFVIVKKRYQGRITLSVNVSDEDAELYVPKLLFQPIVENSIKHGLRVKKGRGRVMINIERKTDFLEVTILDDGVGMDAGQTARMQEALEDPRIGYAEPGSGVSVGTKNVYDRIRLNCGSDYGFTVYSEKSVGTIVTFRLPIWESAREETEQSQRR